MFLLTVHSLEIFWQEKAIKYHEREQRKVKVSLYDLKKCVKIRKRFPNPVSALQGVLKIFSYHFYLLNRDSQRCGLQGCKR